jgi:serine/threonine protein kinase
MRHYTVSDNEVCAKLPWRHLSCTELFAGLYSIDEVLAISHRNTVVAGDERRTGQAIVIKYGNCGAPAPLCGCGIGLNLTYEALILQRLGQQAVPVPRLYTTVIWEGRTYLVIERVLGCTLEELIANGPLSPRATVAIGNALCCLLGLAHAAGVAHQDVKPANAILTHDGQLVLIDWDAARRLDQFGVRQPLFTPGYASLEQLRGEVRASNDVFGLGRTLETISQHSSPQLAEVIARATAPIARRYQTIVELQQALCGLREAKEMHLAWSELRSIVATSAARRNAA